MAVVRSVARHARTQHVLKQRSSTRPSTVATVAQSQASCSHSSTACSEAPAVPDSDSVFRRVFADDRRPVLVFDGQCNLCNGGVQAALALDHNGKLRLSGMQSPSGQALLAAVGRDPSDMSTVVLVEADRSYSVRSDAVLKAARYMQSPVAFAAAFAGFVPQSIRDSVYNAVASNRYLLFGKPESLSLVDERYQERFIV